MYYDAMREKREQSKYISKCKTDNPRRKFLPIFLDEYLIYLLESHPTMECRNNSTSTETDKSSNERSERKDEFVPEYIDLMLYMYNLGSISDDTRKECKKSSE